MKKSVILFITAFSLVVVSISASSKVKDEKVNSGGLNAFSVIQIGKLSFDKGQ